MAPSTRYHKYPFPTEYYDDLHPDDHINFQMNRWATYIGPEAFDELRAIAPRVNSWTDWKREVMGLAEAALAQGRELKAGYYFRLAEFFMWPGDPDKLPARRRFLELVDKACGIRDDQRFQIPYHDGTHRGCLPAYRFEAPAARGTVVAFGGGDSYVEEWMWVVPYIQKSGYHLILFEGPGQGGALMEHNLPMTHEWHRPVGAVLDFFGLDDVTLIGISGGGMASLRAAAFEPRVRRVVAYDVLYDVYDVFTRRLPPAARAFVNLGLRLRLRGLINDAVGLAMKRKLATDGLLRQAMHIHGASTPYDLFQKIKRETTADISHLITQDVLLLAGAEDFAIPVHHFHRQIAALTHARSLTARLFTRHEQAQNHCQVGNVGLALDTILNWLEFTLEHRR